VRVLSLETVEDILLGCAVLGTGGGGSLARGLETVRADAAAGKTVRLAALDELEPDTLVVSPYFAGSVSPLSPEQVAAYRHLPVAGESACLIAARALAEYLGRPVGAVVATELGGGNTASALSAAAHLGVPLLDADPAGRAVPELIHSTLFLAGVSITPMAAASQFGDVTIITRVVDDFRAEALVRAMAVVSQNKMGVADHPAPARELRGKLVEGSVSHAGRIGEAIRKARAAGADPVEAARAAGGGLLLFRGTVTRASWRDEAGFTVGEIDIRGTDADAGSTYHIRFKNEHMAAWRDGRVDVTVPDLIAVLETVTAEPVLNPEAAPGQAVSVLGFPAPGHWRTARGLSVFGPRYAGVDADYVPVEEHRRAGGGTADRAAARGNGGPAGGRAAGGPAARRRG